MTSPYLPFWKNRHIDANALRGPTSQENLEIDREIEKEHIKDQKKHAELLDEAADKSKTVLYRAKAVFPFDFFPSELIIDMTKATIIDRRFFLSGNVKSVYHRDIIDVEIETGPFFSTLMIIDQYFTDEKLHIHYLKKKEAVKARETIMGLVSAIKINVDVGIVDSEEVLNKIRKLSRAQHTPSI